MVLGIGWLRGGESANDSVALFRDFSEEEQTRGYMGETEILKLKLWSKVSMKEVVLSYHWQSKDEEKEIRFVHQMPGLTSLPYLPKET